MTILGRSVSGMYIKFALIFRNDVHLFLPTIMTHVFLNTTSTFSSVRSPRNCYTKDVVLFEEDSILPLPECLEASGW